MKGFIEVQESTHDLTININHIVIIHPDGSIELSNQIIRTNHSYEEVKQKIKQATL